jgi:heme exporter protein D
MGGYGAYVWPAYGVAAVVMLGLLATSLHASRAQRRELAELEAAGRTRRRPRSGAASNEGSGDDTQTS